MPSAQPVGLGRSWPVRRLRPGERGLVEGHLLRLRREDRLMRFCHSANDAYVSSYCAGIDWGSATVLGCFPAGELRGLAELIPMEDRWPRPAELALSVERRFQNQGIGSALLRHALVVAQNRLLGPISMICLTENTRMQQIALKFGARLERGVGQMEGKIRPPLPSYLSFAAEAAAESRAVLLAAFETLDTTAGRMNPRCSMTGYRAAHANPAIRLPGYSRKTDGVGS